MTRKKYIKLITKAANSNMEDVAKSGKELIELKDKHDKAMKARFDFLKKYSKGRSKKLNNPWHGKNKAQRNRLAGAFSGFRNNSRDPFYL